MPSPYNYLVITPNADAVGVNAATGITLDVPVYTEADPPTRSQTHAWANTSFTAALETAIETPTTGARAVFPNSVFIKWHKTNWNDPQWPKINPQAELVSRGLTTSAT